MAMSGPDVVYEFEEAAAQFVGAPYAVATTSCTMAIFLALQYLKHKDQLPGYVNCPRRTYAGVAMSIVHAGAKISWVDFDWDRSWYVLGGTPVHDAARIFCRGMYLSGCGTLVCTSHHWNKPLGLSQGGLIFTDDSGAQAWLRRARFDGRTPGVPIGKDKDLMIGWHAYMSPEVAAQGLQKLMFLGDGCEFNPGPNHYPDLSTYACFRPHTWNTAIPKPTSLEDIVRGVV